MRRDYEVRQPGGYDVDAASDETALLCMDESLAVQSEKEDADINTIAKRFALTGQMPQSLRVPTNAVFEDVFNFQEAQNVMVAASRAFMELPADVRSKFANDPHEFVDYVSDEKNFDQLKLWGLTVEREKPTEAGPTKVVIVNPEKLGDNVPVPEVPVEE